MTDKVSVNMFATPIHIFHDGSSLSKISAKAFSRLPIWNGNRILDEDHKKMIAKAVAQNPASLDAKTYHTVTVTEKDFEGDLAEKYYIVDGQHRASILNEYFAVHPDAEDFQVLVVNKVCKSECEVIAYFKILNTTKAIQWREDPVMAANRYVDALVRVFNKNPKKLLIRNGKTRKPYLSVERLREECQKRRLGIGAEDDAEAFALKVYGEHQKELEALRRLGGADDLALVKCMEVEFLLAYDDKFLWLDG